ncbi:MAG: hypothetical protein AAF798_05155 [Bacteroidota bacterium]
MTETIQIPKKPSLPASKDYNFLRQKGIDYLQQIAGSVWTDYNLHDPGITLLEAMCYALTEVGFRLNLDIKDILASSPTVVEGPDFFPLSEIAPSFPVTLNDFRKLLIDLPEIKNAWIEQAQGVAPVAVSGLYEVLIEMEEDPELGNLNSSIIPLGGNEGLAIEVASGETRRFIIEASFPFWDDESVRDLREAITIDSVNIISAPLLQASPNVNDPAQFFWYCELEITYNGGSTTSFGMILKIASGSYEEVDLPFIEAAILDAITDTSDTGPVALFNRKILQAQGVLDRVRIYLSRYRNLCEDFQQYKATKIQEIAVHANLEVGPMIDPNQLLAEIYYEIDRFLSPEIRFYTLNEMLAKGKPIEAIYNGPLLQNGFIEDAELEGLKGRAVIYASDLIRIIMERNETAQAIVNTPTNRPIVSVQNFFLRNYLNNLVVTRAARNCLDLFESRIYKPKLSLAKSSIRLFRKGVELATDSTTIIQRFNELKAANNIATANSAATTSLPAGRSFPLSAYRSIQNDLPQIYGTAPDSLPANSSPARLGKAKQLKAYLLLFDQILANYMAQLVGVRQMLSISTTTAQTYFHQIPNDVDLIDSLLSDNYASTVAALTEAASVASNRRGQFLDHLLARFGEQLSNYEALRPDAATFNTDKEHFLQEYAQLSQTRANAGLSPIYADFGLHQVEDSNYTWSWPVTASSPLLQSPSDVTFDNLFELYSALLQVIVLGREVANYQLAGPADNLTITLLDGDSNAIARSTQTYASPAAVDAAIATWAQNLAGAWGTSKRATVEHKLCHLLGFEDCTRRQLWGALDDVFTTITAGASPNETFGFRLTDDGSPLLESVDDLTNNPQELEELMYQVIRFGQARSNYQATGSAPNLGFELLDADLQVIARASDSFADEEALASAIDRTIALLTDGFSAQPGFHLIEHALLRPTSNADEVLALPLNAQGEVIGGLIDPYSFQLTLFFPLGAPHFRDPSFQQLVEETVYTEFPAHILPRILWLELPEFHRLETAYRNWVDTWVRIDADPSDVQLAQDDLVLSLNEVTQQVLDTNTTSL